MTILDGIKVVDLTTNVAGPGAAKLLAEWGADVIKIEPIEGEQWRSIGFLYQTPIKEDENPIFDLENMGKRAISLNLRDPKAVKILKELIGSADVFLTNTRMKSLERMGLDYESLKEDNPELVYFHFSGYGSEGEESSRPGYDNTAFWNRGGFIGSFQVKGSDPIVSPGSVGDHITSLAITGGVLAGLIKAKRTGEGSEIRGSLYGTAIYINSTFITMAQYNPGRFPTTNELSGNPMSRPYLTKDGRWIQLTLIPFKRYFEPLMKVLKLDHLIEDERFNTEAAALENQIEFYELIRDGFLNFDFEELKPHFDAGDFNYELAYTFEEVASDPQAMANHFFLEKEYPSGNITRLATPPVQFSREKPTYKPAPKLGEHTREVLSDLGYSPEEIDELIAEGTINASE